jgi:membrane protein
MEGVENSRVEQVATDAHSPSAESLWRLGGLTPRQLGRAVFEHTIADNVFGRAAELAFDFLFALFPLIFLMMTSVGLFASHGGKLPYDLVSHFADFLPPTAFQLLRRVANEVLAHASRGKLTFGIVSAVWCISSSITTMISFLNAAHGVRETRSWLKVRAIALGLSLLISTLLLTALFMLLVGSHFVGWLRAELELHPLLVLIWKALQWPIVIFFIAQSCSLIYYYGYYGLDLKDRRPWHWFTPGAAFGGFIWLVASFGFRVYLHFFDNYSVSYGSLGAVMILLVWLYVTGLAFLIGAEINSGIELTVRRGKSE